MQKGLKRNLFLLIIALSCIGAGWGLVQQYLNQVGFIPIEVIAFSDQIHYEDPNLIRDAVSPWVAEGFLGCDVKKIKQQLELLPWIAKASVQRKWPNRLQIKLSERQPIAIWEDSGVIDEHGKIFFPEKVQGIDDLPRFTGNQVYVDDMVEIYKMVRNSLRPLHLSVQQLSIMPDQGWEVFLDDGLRIILGKTELSERLHRFVLAYTDKLRTERKHIRVVDLRYTNGLAVG